MNHDIEKALDNLEKRAQDIQHYMNIMSKVKTVNVADDQDFQREFDFFYKVRRNAEWRKVFFEIFERKKKKNCSYKEIITELYEGTGQVETSFASKMLASIDENMPIWDSKVLDRIGIKSSNKRGQQKLEETIELYDVIVQWYSDLKANKASYNEYITSFDSRFPDYSSISDTKKIDFILWAMGEEEEDTIPSVYIQNMEALSDAAKIASRSIEAYPGVVSAVKQIADCMKQYQGISQTFMENARRISETIRPIFEYQQQIMESVRPALESLGKTIAAITATIPKIEIPESFFKTLGNLRYLYTLKSITWPLFLEDDEELKEIITGLCGDKKENYPLDELAASICNYYNSEKLDNIVDGWRKLLKDDSERLLLLEEAVNLHNSGCYYGATSIMMCQVDGLICDISNYTDENGLICSEDDEKEICELYHVDFQNHKKFAKTSEKHMILRLAAMTENAVFYWEAMTDYIYNVVLTSHGEEYRDHNPLRNKICHGDQLDFGTEEKSLKSIFVIDLLLNLKSEMQWLAEHKFDK